MGWKTDPTLFTISCDSHLAIGQACRLLDGPERSPLWLCRFESNYPGGQIRTRRNCLANSFSRRRGETDSDGWYVTEVRFSLRHLQVAPSASPAKQRLRSRSDL